MNVCFILLTILTSISHAKPVVVPLNNEQYLTINDLNDLKIGFLFFVITSLLSLIKWVWGFFSGERKELTDRVKSLEKSQDEVLSELKTMHLLLAQVKDAQLTESEVRSIVRNESEYEAKLRNRN